MTTNSREKAPICPYMALADDAESRHPCASSQHSCQADGTARAVSVHSQTASCLGLGYRRCQQYRQSAPTSEPQQPERDSFGSLDATLAEGALVSLMIAMIVFGLFAIAPRPSPSASGDNQPVATKTEEAKETVGVENPPPTAAVQLATQLTLPTATPVPPTRSPVPPTRSPVRTQVPSPTIGPDRTYVVRAGDTLFSIARSLGATVDTLAKANGLSDPKLLRAGQKLRVP